MAQLNFFLEKKSVEIMFQLSRRIHLRYVRSTICSNKHVCDIAINSNKSKLARQLNVNNKKVVTIETSSLSTLSTKNSVRYIHVYVNCIKIILFQHDKLYESLCKIVGTENVSKSEQVRSHHGKDESHFR